MRSSLTSTVLHLCSVLCTDAPVALFYSDAWWSLAYCVRLFLYLLICLPMGIVVSGKLVGCIGSHHFNISLLGKLMHEMALLCLTGAPIGSLPTHSFIHGSSHSFVPFKPTSAYILLIYLGINVTPQLALVCIHRQRETIILHELTFVVKKMYYHYFTFLNNAM